jgi:hypothetical protein
VLAEGRRQPLGLLEGELAAQGVLIADGLPRGVLELVESPMDALSERPSLVANRAFGLDCDHGSAS